MIPKRALAGFVGTLLGLSLLLNFKTPATATLPTSSGLDTGTDTAVVEESAPPAGTDGSSGDATVPTASPTTTDEPTPSTSTSAYVDGTYTGPVVSMRFGDVQLEVTISGGQLADVVALEMPSGDHRTEDISAQVEPWLREEALTAQSAEIDLISGATYTSRAYAESLQAALDAAAA